MATLTTTQTYASLLGGVIIGGTITWPQGMFSLPVVSPARGFWSISGADFTSGSVCCIPACMILEANLNYPESVRSGL